MSFKEVITQAGRRRKTVKLKLKAKKGQVAAQSVEFEPYSFRELAGKESFFCLEIESCTYLNVDMSTILDAEITDRNFKPRFPVAF